MERPCAAKLAIHSLRNCCSKDITLAAMPAKLERAMLGASGLLSRAALRKTRAAYAVTKLASTCMRKVHSTKAAAQKDAWFVDMRY